MDIHLLSIEGTVKYPPIFPRESRVITINITTCHHRRINNNAPINHGVVIAAQFIINIGFIKRGFNYVTDAIETPLITKIQIEFILLKNSYGTSLLIRNCWTDSMWFIIDLWSSNGSLNVNLGLECHTSQTLNENHYPTNVEKQKW